MLVKTNQKFLYKKVNPCSRGLRLLNVTVCRGSYPYSIHLKGVIRGD